MTYSFWVRSWNPWMCWSFSRMKTTVLGYDFWSHTVALFGQEVACPPSSAAVGRHYVRWMDLMICRFCKMSAYMNNYDRLEGYFSCKTQTRICQDSVYFLTSIWCPWRSEDLGSTGLKVDGNDPTRHWHWKIQTLPLTSGGRGKPTILMVFIGFFRP